MGQRQPENPRSVRLSCEFPHQTLPDQKKIPARHEGSRKIPATVHRLDAHTLGLPFLSGFYCFIGPRLPCIRHSQTRVYRILLREDFSTSFALSVEPSPTTITSSPSTICTSTLSSVCTTRRV